METGLPRALTASEIITLLNEQTHPEHRR